MVVISIEEWTWQSRSVLAATLDLDWTVRRANPALEHLAGRGVVGMALADLIEPSQHAALERRLASAEDAWRTGIFAFRGGGRPSVDRRLWLARSGDELLLIGEPVVDEQERLVEKVLELNDELVTAHRELVRQRAASEASAERVRHLEAIAAAGLAGLDLGVVLKDVLRVIMRAVAGESAAIVLREGEGLVVRAVVGSSGGLAEGDQLAVGEGIAGEIVADGRPRLVRAGDAAPGDAAPRDAAPRDDAAPRHASPLAGDPEDGGLAGVPLVFDGEVQGALQVRARAGSSFDAADLRLLLPAAERAALAISRAQLLERERGIAETLQRALLPDRLPDVPGLRLSAHFEPAAGEVGGDWYDAVVLDSGEVALAIGDVAGKGIPAAALMGELRGGMRAGVLDGGEPNDMLRRLDRLADRAGRMATVVLVVLDPASGALRLASAGHLPPLLVEPGGAVRFLRGGASTPLLAYDAEAGAGTDTLPPGGRLLLYTDGLVERRGEPIDASLERLAATAAAHTGPLPDLAAHLLAELYPPAGGLRDDIALLAVELER